jgi:hypothetical protein
MKRFIAAFVLFAASQALGQGSTYNYDYRTGNSYRTYTDTSGTTYVNGYNYNTGSSWRSTVDKDGDQRGTDSQGNSWQYNARSHSYYNYGTGKMCTGTGYSRICTGGDD